MITGGRDEELARLTGDAAAGDGEALGELVRATQGDVWRFVAHLAGVAAADDLTQETYLRALRSLPTFGHRGPVRVWLLAIARHVVATHFDQVAREARRRQRFLAAWADPAGGGPAGGDPGEALALGELVDSLPRGYRDAFVLTQVLGLSYAHAATVCRCPVGTIRSRVARAREALVVGYAAESAAESADSAQKPGRRQRL
jgi:RNA polymerase sigma-70 factor (ECF subfamily)